MSSIYPADEFEYPDPDMPVGAHRRPPSRWRPVIPFLIILAVVPLLAWGFSAFLQRGGSDDVVVAQSESAPQSSQSEQREPIEPPTVEPNDDGEPSAALDDPGEKPEEEKPVEAEKEPEEPKVTEPDYDTYVLVLNETGINGYAAEVAGTLSNGGFGNTAADNTSGWITDSNTVFYSSEDQEATANKVAEVADISRVVLDADATGGSGIIVLLVN